MSKYRIVIDCDGPFLPSVNVSPHVEDDGSVSASVWRWQDGEEDRIGCAYEDSPGPLVVVAGNTGGNPNGVPGSVSVSVERVRVHIGAPPCALSRFVYGLVSMSGGNLFGVVDRESEWIATWGYSEPSQHSASEREVMRACLDASRGSGAMASGFYWEPFDSLLRVFPDSVMDR